MTETPSMTLDLSTRGEVTQVIQARTDRVGTGRDPGPKYPLTILIYYGLLLVMVFSLVLIAARIRPDLPQPLNILGQLVIVVGGMAVVSHLSNQIGRDYLAIVLGVLGGLVLGFLIWKLRSNWSNRRVEVAAVIYIVAFVWLSLDLDWFDPRGLIPTGTLLSVGLLLPVGSPSRPNTTRPGSDPISVMAAVVFLVIGAVVATTMRYSGMLIGDELL